MQYKISEFGLESVEYTQFLNQMGNGSQVSKNLKSARDQIKSSERIKRNSK